MKIVGAFLVASILIGVCSQNAEARWHRYWYYNAEEVAKQQRANMAERTHQLKELQECQRLNEERERISAQSTVRSYGVPGAKVDKVRRGDGTLVQRVKTRRAAALPLY